MPFVILMTLYIFFGGLYDVFNALALRKNMGAIVSKGRIFLSISSLFVQIAFGVLKCGATGFVLGLVLGYFCSVIYLSTALKIKPRHWLIRVGVSKIRFILLKNRHDLFYGGPSSLFYTLQNNLPAVIFTIVGGASVGGYYALIQRVVFNPVIIATGVLTQTILPWLSRTRYQGSGALLIKCSTFAATAMLGTVFLFYPFTDDLFAVIFGEHWREAGLYASLLFLLLPYRVLYDVLSILLISENRQRSIFLTRGFALLLGISVIFCFNKFVARELFFLFSLIQAMCALAGIGALAIILKLSLSHLLRVITIGLIFSYLAVGLEGVFLPYFGENLINIFFGLTGIITLAFSLVSAKLIKDDESN